MTDYALTAILGPDLKEEESKKIQGELGTLLDKFEAREVKEEKWGVRDLAYLIKKQQRGFYLHCYFKADPSQIPPLDKALKLKEDILRYLIVRV